MSEDVQVSANPQDTQPAPPTIEEQKLTIERERLKLDIRKEQTTRILLVLPVLVSIAAMLVSFAGERFRSREAALLELQKMEVQISEPTAARLELFKKLTEGVSDQERVKAVYKEIFSQDSRVVWQQKLKDMQDAEFGP